MADALPVIEPPAGYAAVVARFRVRADRALSLIERLSEDLDAEDVVLSTSEESRTSWSVALYFHERPDEAEIRALVTRVGGRDAGKALVFESVAARDWITASLAGLKPVCAGRFVIHGRHDRGKVPWQQIGIEIEAALAFGTGHHGTTRGCLLAFHSLLKQRVPRRVLDIGTGTGVLAIAAALASPARVSANDIDPVAVAVAHANAVLNGVGSRVRPLRATGLNERLIRSGKNYDLIFANILAAPLKRMARDARALLAPGGRIVLSGLLPEHANAVLEAYRLQGLALQRRLLLDDWVTLVMRRGQK